MCFREDKQKVGIFAYHLEGFRVPQFGNHRPESASQYIPPFSVYAKAAKRLFYALPGS